MEHSRSAPAHCRSIRFFERAITLVFALIVSLIVLGAAHAAAHEVLPGKANCLVGDMADHGPDHREKASHEMLCCVFHCTPMAAQSFTGLDGRAALSSVKIPSMADLISNGVTVSILLPPPRTKAP